jgi:hypothetical protein
MKRREFITVLGGMAAWPLAARAAARQGLAHRRARDDVDGIECCEFRGVSPKLAGPWIHRGANLIIEYRSAEGLGERFADLAADLLRLNVDVNSRRFMCPDDIVMARLTGSFATYSR